MDHLRSGVQDQPGQHGKTPALLKIQKISQVWWPAPVVPATQEAEAGGLLEPRRCCIELRLCHCTPAWVTERDILFPKTNKQKIIGQVWWLIPVILALWEAKGGRSPEVRTLGPAWPTWQNPISTKNTKISGVWW